MPDYPRIYAHQEYMTPGAAETVEIIADTVQPTEGTWLLDVASGKGEAASTLAGRYGCRIACIEPFDAFVHIATSKFWFFNLRDLVGVLRADGKLLPVRDGSFDAAYCIGAPSIVGLHDCLREMGRAVKPGGWVVASDIVWREQPGPLGKEWRWLREVEQTTAAEYSGALEAAGLAVEQVTVHGRSVWEDYHRPMLQVASEAKTAQPADIFFADEIEADVDLEQRAADLWLDYATFVARKR
jgi:SAM-dependent methyltransferase